MKCLVLVALSISVSLADDYMPDQDDTVLLQTRAVPTEVRKTKSRNLRKVHRLRLDVQDGSASLIQGHQVEGAVYEVCTVDDAGESEESTDDFGVTTDSCGQMELFNEAGDVLGVITGCLPDSVGQKTCFSFAEASDWFDSIGNALYTVPLVTSDENDVLLIEVPNMDQSSFEEAQEQIQMKTKEFSGSHVLLQGKGAKQLHPTHFYATLAYFLNGYPY